MINAAAILRGDRSAAAALLAGRASPGPPARWLRSRAAGRWPRASPRTPATCEVNLNCGCPSDRVQCRRVRRLPDAAPQLVAECVAAMKQAVRIPVTVKMPHRRGGPARGRAALRGAAALRFDDADAEQLAAFARALLGAGADRADRACAQGGAGRAVAAREPHRAAAALRRRGAAARAHCRRCR